MAARLEGLADPGGICISGTVFDHVKGKLDAGFEDLGPQQLKNIAEPVGTYRVTWASISNAPTRPLPAPLPAPAKPSIAVLPFDNMSSDHEQEYFSDGISEDLTTALSRFDWLFVIARTGHFKAHCCKTSRAGILWFFDVSNGIEADFPDEDAGTRVKLAHLVHAPRMS